MQVKPATITSAAMVIVMTAGLTGCNGEPAQPEQWVYQCGAQTITVTDMGSESIDVVQAGNRYSLQATAAASGTRYVSADQQVEFWSKGHEAILNKQGNPLPLCLLDGHLPSEYSVRGHEPKWQLSSKQLTLLETRMTSPRQWLLEHPEGHQLTLSAKLCVDSMTGRAYPYHASYIRDNAEYLGCGGDSQRLLAGSSWQMVGSYSEQVRPQLQFGTELAVSGFTGCNQFRGSYNLTPEVFGFNPLAVTRKACETEIMAAEHDFLRQLLEVEQFSFDDQGRLQLHPRGGELMVWEKTSEPKS